MTVGGAPATAVVVSGETRIQCTTPPGTSGAADVVVTRSGGGDVTAAGAFTYAPDPPPVVTRVSPAEGPAAGGTALTIDGSGFLGTVNVTVGAAAARDVVVSGGTRIQCVAPPGPPGTAALVVSSDSGTLTLPAAFTYNATPTLTAAPAPAVGSQEGGTPITIRGTDFRGEVIVTFGGNPASDVVVTAGERIDCLTPPATSAGPVEVVMTSSTCGTVSQDAAFSYLPRPTITAPITPSSGLSTGGTWLTIQGTNFLGAVTVLVGGVPATTVTVTSGSRITCRTAPSAVTGPVDVTVTSSTHGSVTQTGAFTVIPALTLTGISPTNGPEQGGNPLTITGTNFVGIVTVDINSKPATGVVVTSTTSLTCIAPSGMGSSSVVVRSSTNGAALLNYTFNPAPTITAIRPPSGPPAGTVLTIDGANFGGTVSVLIGASPATDVVVTGTTRIRCVAPPAPPGRADVTVISSSHGSSTAASGFIYNPEITFNVSSTIAAGDDPDEVATGDLNRDGIPDLAVVNRGSNSVTVLLGDGAGAFTPAPGSPLAVGARPAGVVIADLGGDRVPYLVVTNSGSSTATLFSATGGGAFTRALLSMDPGPGRTVVGDFDRDGMADLATCYEAGNLVRARFAPFGGTIATATGAGPQALVAADFNRDGKLDLAVANTASGTVSVLLGTAAPGFSSVSPIFLGGAPAALAVADLNRDGRTDLLVANRGDNSVSVLLGDGAGGFVRSAGSPLVLAAAPRGVGAADFDGDGVADVAVTTAESLRVFSGRGDATFHPPAIVPGGPAFGSVCIADYDRDGRPDVAVANGGSPGSLVVIRNTSAWVSEGLFTSAKSFAPSGTFDAVASADLNRDGLVDVVGTGGWGVSVSLGTSAGAFALPTQFRTDNDTQPPQIADLNRDGVLDILTSELYPGRVDFFRGDGSGRFAAATTLDTAPLEVSAGTAVGDFNRDGRLDVFAGCEVNALVFGGNGAGAFSQIATVAGVYPWYPTSVAVADLNRDGKLDAIVADVFEPVVSVYLGNGAGGFGNQISLTFTLPNYQLIPPTGPGCVHIADLNRDGVLDIAVGSSDPTAIHTIAIFIGLGTGEFTLRGTVNVGAAPRSIESIDSNRDGIPDLAVANRMSGTVSVLNGNGLGDFPTIRSFATGSGAEDLAIDDVNRDGLADLIVGSGSGFAVLFGK